jgi:Short C-terminal domain
MAAPAEVAAMRRAIALSAAGLGTTSPNPPVGCVVLDRAGEVAGAGYHERKGEADCEPGLMTAPPTLTIESRSGTFAVNLVRAARKEASRWPGWILEAQEAAQPKASSSNDIASRLAQLAALRDNGALTPEEFAAAKSRILG